MTSAFPCFDQPATIFDQSATMRVLLVDDETSLLELLGKFLGKNGHHTVTASSVTAAKALLENASTETVDVAVIDLSLPDGSGEEIASHIVEHLPGVRVIMATGYAYDPPQALRGKVAVLQKPFLPRALLNVLIAD
jgi:two-component system OmpR family response regulator